MDSTATGDCNTKKNMTAQYALTTTCGCNGHCQYWPVPTIPMTKRLTLAGHVWCVWKVLAKS